MEKLAREGVIVGLISDNIYEDVQTLCQLFGIWEYFDKSFVNVRLWDGDANKGLMISEVLRSQKNKITEKVIFIDDSQKYEAQMTGIGCDFIQSPQGTFPKDAILNFFGLK